MIRVFDWLLSTEGFVPRRNCGAWTPELIWLHAGSDIMIWLAYVSIPIALGYFARHQGLRRLSRIVWLFAAFILCCGFTHLIEAIIFDHPLYQLSGVMKFITAVVSWTTVLVLIPSMPSLVRLLARSAGTSGEMPSLPYDYVLLLKNPQSILERAWPFTVALAVSAFSVFVRWIFEPLMSSDHAFVIPLLGVVFIAWHSGFWPAIMSLVLTMLAVVYFFVEPRFSFLVYKLSDQLAVGFFFFAGVCCALLGQAQISNSRRAAKHLAISQSKQQELAVIAEQLAISQRETNDTLSALIKSEKLLQHSHLDLEQRVAQRTFELSEAVAALQDEVDIRRQAEMKVEATAEELRRSNGELEQFAYVASHDLQEPLRKIQAFGDRLKIKCGAALDETGTDYLQRMLNSAGRMRQLIHDLLELSRVTSKAAAFVTVDLNAIANAVLSDLEERIAQTNGSVEIGQLGTIEADPLQMRQLFQNLLGNALKFHKPDAFPQVTVRFEQIAGERPMCRISVADNGIGFEEKYASRIFQVFQRLHSRNEYEGTGVGLAICHKIVHRHGGEIVARSQPDVGTTFTVTLPIVQPISPMRDNG